MYGGAYGGYQSPRQSLNRGGAYDNGSFGDNALVEREAQMKMWARASTPSPRKLRLQGDEAIVAVHQRNAANTQRALMRRLLEAAGGRTRMVNSYQVQHCALAASLDPAIANSLNSVFAGSGAYGGKQLVSIDALMRKITAPVYVPPESAAVAAYRQKREAYEEKLRAEAERAAKKAERMARDLRGHKNPAHDDPFAAVSKEELSRAHRAFAKHFFRRFGTIRRGFRLLDADNTGVLTRAEFRNLDDLFNLDGQFDKRVMDCLIKLADYDNSGVIKFAEFARLISAEDILNLKDTLTADPNAHHEFGGDYPKGDPRAPKIRVPTLREGVKPMEIRHAQKLLVSRLDKHYETPQEAFEDFDKDGSGKISRPELIGLCIKLVQGAHREVVLQNMIDFADIDVDGSISYQEFLRILEAEDILSAKSKPPPALFR